MDDGIVQQFNTAKDRGHTDIFGNADEWERYRLAFAELINEATLRGVIPAHRSPSDVFKRIDELGTPVLDAEGNLWIEMSGGGSVVGASAANVLAPTSDLSLAYQLLLARVEAALNGGRRDRPTMAAFEGDWALLQQAHDRALRQWQLRPIIAAR